MNRLILVAVSALAIPAIGNAANVSLTADDGFGTSSFNTGNHWSDSTAPGSANDYFTAGYRLRTPAAFILSRAPRSRWIRRFHKRIA